MARKTNAQLSEELEVAQTQLEGTKQELELALSRAGRLSEDRAYVIRENERLEGVIRELDYKLQAEQDAHRTVMKLADVSRITVETIANQAEQQGETVAVLHDVIGRIMSWHETDRIERSLDQLMETVKSKGEPEVAEA